MAAEGAPIFTNTLGASLQLDTNQIGMIIGAEIGGGALAISTTVGSVRPANYVAAIGCVAALLVFVPTVLRIIRRSG